jgi:peroxiredoxin Q/BCP
MDGLLSLRHARNCALLVAALALAACASQQRPDQANEQGKGLLPVGAEAPDITGLDVAGRPSKLSEALAQGHAAVVYFYPKDSTPGCTREACAFRDAWARYSAQNVQIFGVSRDSESSHRAFQQEHQLPFPLVPDEAGHIQAAYGVPSRLGGLASRVSFLVDPHGRIAHVWPDVDPGVHADEVLQAAAQLK